MAIARWRRQGYLDRVLPGVFAVGHCAPSVEADLAAALLYAGDGSMLSHALAIWWRGLSERRPPVIEISIPGRRRSRKGIRIHCRRDIERVWHNGLPVTSAPQALLDYSATASMEEVRRVVAEAEFKHVDLNEIHELLGRGKPGSRKLREALKRHEPQLARTKNKFERKLLAICEDEDIPIPDFNVFLEGLKVDAYWKDAKLVVELDGYDGHHTRAQLDRDRRRDLKLRGAGMTVIRYDWFQLTNERKAVAADIKAARARAGAD